ncbi:VWA domain-containing protein [Aliirhizobium smilacinae]|uniref:VWA domain-containing protein n=1 Tax=Aliirhizobium smilacinae TaxID=1395944 RepID=A0A5C4XP81_9HYPH|nr:VWA domain-containing protein [Rhizobium smilacinae]TNM64771.1 VWA domain-containing protein [Rhizobium smilacinae]
MMADFHFLRPWWLLVLVLPPLIVWMASRSDDLRSRWKCMIAPHLLENLLVEPDARRHAFPSWLAAAVLAIATLGVAGPTWKREPPPFVSDTASLVIAVDLSQSMDNRDVSPSRIERAKLKIRDVLSSRAGGRTGVIAYAGTAHLVVPLTDDVELIASYTDALATRIMPTQGQDTKAALKLANDLLRADGTPGTVLLLTDGIESDAAEALDRGVVILGIGTAGGGLDIEALRHVAGQADAPVATITNDDADVRWIVRQVRTNFAAAAAGGDRWHDAGWYLVFPLTLLFALSFRRGWVVKVACFLLATQLFSPEPVKAAGFLDMWLTADQQGRLAFDRGDYATASTLFRDRMWKGIALYRAGNFKAASESFGAVEAPEARFDQGNALLRLGDFENAVAAYRVATSQRTDWPEAQANLAIAERLLKMQQDDEDQPQEPNEKPDEVKIDDKGKKGKAGKVEVADQTTELWMKNIVVSPTDLMARKFAIEEQGDHR